MNNENTNFLDILNGKESLKIEASIETKSIIVLCLSVLLTALLIIMFAKK